jgi:hypothetical protein
LSQQRERAETFSFQGIPDVWNLGVMLLESGRKEKHGRVNIRRILVRERRGRKESVKGKGEKRETNV